ncbi:MAG: multicopper oxidase domain-containing protein [Thermoleophilia bacterium]
MPEQHTRRGPVRRVIPGALALCAILAAATALMAGGGADDRLVASAHGSAAGTDYWAAVAGNTGQTPAAGTVRTYYIRAERVRWNYAPGGRNRITGSAFDDDARVFVEGAPDRVGSTYTKCLYRGYTDGTFRHRLRPPSDERNLGILGPVIRAAVGDTIRVVFRNSCRFPVSVHPHGVFYGKTSEGAPYADGTRGSGKRDDDVPTGGRHVYTWRVPERAGPGPGDGSSVMWMYHSHADEVGDTYAGLMGPMVVTRADMARPDATPSDVDQEVFELFAVMDENQSPFLEDELRGLRPRGPRERLRDDEDFGESNLMHSINGYVYGTGPMVTLRRGAHVRWYVMSMGTEVDLHTPHWHGNTVTVSGMRMDVVSLLPASMVVADMVPDDPGVWLFHCHVNDHITAGMATRYRVVS